MNTDEVADAYGRAVGTIYDELYPAFGIADLIEFLSRRLDAGAAVLEFGSGTGRVAIPLAEAGFRVTAFELSEQMIRLHLAKDPAALVDVYRQDFTAEHDITGQDACVIANNTLFMILDRDGQRRALVQACNALKPGGILVTETYNPDAFVRRESPFTQYTPLGRGQRVLFDTIHIARVQQELTVVRTLIDSDEVSTFVEQSRYTWPSELDLLAELAGFESVARFSSWSEEAVTDGSASHIAVFRKPAEQVSA